MSCRMVRSSVMQLIYCMARMKYCNLTCFSFCDGMKIGITGMREGPGLSSCDNTMREKVFLDPRERK